MTERFFTTENSEKQPEDKSPPNLITLAMLDTDSLTHSRANNIKIESSANSALDNDFGAKLSRQANVLGGGILDGTLDSLSEAAKDPLTLLKAGASVGTGILLTYMSARRGKMRLAAQGAGLTLGGVFAKDLYDHGQVASSILKDTWQNPENTVQNRAKMAQTMGPLVSDTLIYSAGGLSGVRFAQKRWGTEPAIAGPSAYENIKSRLTNLTGKKSEPITAKPPEYVEFMHRDMTILGMEKDAISMMRLPKEAPLAKAVSEARNSVAKIESLTLTEEGLGGSMATAVSISKDGKMVTNQHQIADAINITVFDPKGNPHSAHVLKAGDPRELDLAILQLDRPSSFKAFEPINIVQVTPEANSMLAFLGHPEGLNTMNVSRGTFGHTPRGRSHFFQCNANVAGGNCGSAVVNMEGSLLAIMKGDVGNSQRGVLAIPAEHIGNLLKSAELPMPNTVRTAKLSPEIVPNPVTRAYAVEHPDMAKATVDEIFGISIDKDLPGDFFHTRARTTTLKGNDGTETLTLATSLNRNTREVTVHPVALNGEAIGPAKTWPGSDIPIKSAELKVTFGESFHSAELKSVNDPLAVLTKGLEFKQQRPSYLSSLEGTLVATESANPIGTGTNRTSQLIDYIRGTSTNGLRTSLETLSR